jgi:hypothetical protein
MARRPGRFGERKLVRYQVRGHWRDKDLIRKAAMILARGGADAAYLRREIEYALDPDPEGGGIWRALRRSPLVGLDLNLEREVVPPRAIHFDE